MEEMKKQLLDEKKDEPDVYPDNFCGRYMRFIWELMEKSETSFAAKCVNFISLSFIIVSTVGMTLSTIPEIAGVDEEGALDFRFNVNNYRTRASITRSWIVTAPLRNH